jgi:hypothetical protein
LEAPFLFLESFVINGLKGIPHISKENSITNSLGYDGGGAWCVGQQI